MISEHDRIINTLKQTDLFEKSKDSFINELVRQSRIIEAPKGKILFSQDDNAEYFYIIQSGWVKMFRETLDGTQAIIDIRSSHDFIGETAIFENYVYPYSAEAIEPANMIIAPLSTLHDELKNNAIFSLHMLHLIARQKRHQDHEIEHRSLQNAPQRIGCFILQLIPNENKKTREGLTIHLPYDKTLIASRLGMQPETFSRALSKLKNETDIVIKGASVKINDMDKLIGYTCAACSSIFPCNNMTSKNKCENV